MALDYKNIATQTTFNLNRKIRIKMWLELCTAPQKLDRKNLTFEVFFDEVKL